MGAVNWLAVVLAANLAVAVGLVWYGPLFGGAPLLGGRKEAGKGPITGWLGAVVLQIVTATMMGHNFARVGAATLHAKPWLYPMMSGGLAIAFVLPALWISYTRQGLSTREALVDGGFWIVAYLAMGAVFWAMG
jgi:Protein of unknown function (DUF1761)